MGRLGADYDRIREIFSQKKTQKRSNLYFKYGVAEVG